MAHSSWAAQPGLGEIDPHAVGEAVAVGVDSGEALELVYPDRGPLDDTAVLDCHEGVVIDERGVDHPVSTERRAVEDDCYARIEQRFEWPMVIAALLVIPVSG